jgi:hypothetical protein
MASPHLCCCGCVVNGDVVSIGAVRKIGSLTFGFRLESNPGVYPISYQRNNNFNSFMVSTITLYDKFDAVHCPVGAYIPAALTAEDCGAGVNDTDAPRGSLLNGTCLCNPPYFGARCGGGCTGTRTLTVYGTDFVVLLFPLFLNSFFLFNC